MARRWIVFKYKFYYNMLKTRDDGVSTDLVPRGPVTLEFIVPYGIPKQDLANAAVKTMAEFSTKNTKTDSGIPVHEFGSLAIEDFVFDVKNLFLVNLGKNVPVHLWLDDGEYFSLWLEPDGIG